MVLMYFWIAEEAVVIVKLFANEDAVTYRRKQKVRVCVSRWRWRAEYVDQD